MIFFSLFFLASISTSVSLQATLSKTGSTLHFDLPLTHTHSISLTLTRSHGDQPEVETSSRNSDVKKEGQYQTTSYEDPSHNAIFSVETSTNISQSETLYYASFSYRESYFNLEPSSAIDAQPSSMHKKVYDLEIEGQAYKLYEEKPLTGGNQGDNKEVSFGGEITSMVNWFNFKLNGPDKQPSGRVIVEFLIVLDASVFQKWMGITKDKQKAIHNIKYYYTHIANGVRANYDQIKDLSYQVTMHFSGIYIAETESDDPYSTDSEVRVGKILQPYKALKKYVGFMALKKSDATFPVFDVATAFTDYLMQGTNGIGYNKVACKMHAVSLNKDKGAYQAINTATHEIGHNLGARHDGDKNSCSYTDQYIMANKREDVTDLNFKNQFVFSSCSLNYFKDYLVYLNKVQLDCLRNVPTSMPAYSTEDFLSQYPGQRYNIDEQCSIIRGVGCKACGVSLIAGSESCKDFCIQMNCSDSTRKKCFNILTIFPAVGTKCGNGMWCVAGKCVPESTIIPFTTE